METNEVCQYAVVHILDTPYHVDRPYTYFLPPILVKTVEIGCFVLVPFGGGNRHVMGLVTALQKKEDLPETLDSSRCKPVYRVISSEFVLNAELLGLVRFLKEMTFCTYGDAAKAVIPTGALKKLTEKYEIVEETAEDFQNRYRGIECPETEIYAAIAAHHGMKRSTVRKNYDVRYEQCAERLVKRGYLRRITVLSDSENRVYTEYVRPLITIQEIEGLLEDNGAVREQYHFRRRSDVYMRLLSVFLENGGVETELEMLRKAGVTAAAVREMEKSGIVARRRETSYRNPYEEAAHAAPDDDNILSEEQEVARAAITDLYQSGEAKAALLHGVTGSGKTRVIKAVMDAVIADGRQVIMLVPEISLTPQSVSIFCAYYGERVAVVHSGLSAGERLDVWRKAKNGEVDLVIGTRSAVFTPFERLGMIVMDEEQEHTYKSDISPKYHARDAARYRCAAHHALLLLASATPSFESYYKAQNGIYTLIELTTRYGHAELPEVIMADLHQDGDITGETPLGFTLASLLAKTQSRGEQSILFVNRRGYQKYISCLSCREPVMCPHCSVPMTLHQSGRGMMQDGSIPGILICHYCGCRLSPPTACPSCQSPHMKAFGYGTQRAEEELGAKFPSMRTLRMDLDTTHGKFAHETILKAFREKEADVLLGTQMVTKGHDFPDVTLVGILSADAMLYQDDYRAGEKAFSLITQVIGRAGRGNKKGIAVIQTYNPEHEILQYAAKQDYRAFYQSAIVLRRSMVFPPFCDIVLVTFSSEEEVEVMNTATAFAQRLGESIAAAGPFSDVKLAVFGPFEAQIYKLNEKFRMRMVIKCRMNKRSRGLFYQLMMEFSERCGSRVQLSIDVNPSNL